MTKTLRRRVLLGGIAATAPVVAACSAGGTPAGQPPATGAIDRDVRTPFQNELRAQKIAVKDALIEARRKITGIIGT
ncbi:MAG TPA: hypothetical protein VNM48_18065 [Chloroflexota bacterium]|nr:hypothetical protein [Chloroflexota bacterium]